MTTLHFKKARTVLGGLAMAAVLCSRIAIGDEPSPDAKKPALAPAVADRVMAITDAVLQHHIDPPARQQMILSGIKALYRAAGLPDPGRLSARVSSLTTREQLAALLAEVWPSKPAKPVSIEALEEALLSGLLKWIPGDAELVSAKDRKIAEQIKGNRYVGIHISLGMDEQAKRPAIQTVIEGGPAYKAGIQAGDLIEQIDGVDTKDKEIRDAVDRIRGDEGSIVTIQVRQPQATKSRIYKVPRGQLPRSTVQGFRKESPDHWDFRIDGPNPIAYLKINEFAASTVRELRKLAGRLESQGYRALVLDLRGLRGDAVHPVVLLADSLLEGGTIGRVRTSQGEKTYEADPDAILRAWPMAVLVDGSTSGTAEWLAAALQDNHRAVLVGSQTGTFAMGRAAREAPNRFAVHHDAVERSTIPIGDGGWSIELITGRLERGDGRPLSGDLLFDPDGPGRFPLESAKPDPVKLSVKPDHLIGANEPAGVARLARPKSSGPERQSLMVGDEPLRKAIEILRASLKKV